MSEREAGRTGDAVGRWRLLRLLASGRTSDVYLARCDTDAEAGPAAVKLIRRPRRPDDPDEAAAPGSLQHPNIAECLDSGTTGDGHEYLVTEYIDGPPITEYADQHALSIHARVELFLQACSAVQHAHEYLTAHLDLKPGNILVTGSGAVKIIDFGLARSVRNGDAQNPSPALSMPYASPEQVQGDVTIGYPADIYALGAVLYELLCGYAPFDPSTLHAELRRRILEDSPTAPSLAMDRDRISDANGTRFRLEPDLLARMRGGRRLSEVRALIRGNLDCVCLFAMRKEVSRRYRWVIDLESDLTMVLAGKQPSIAKSGDPMYSAIRAARRKPLVVFAWVAMLSVVASTASVLTLFSGGRKGAMESRRQLEGAAAPALQALRETLRPRVAADPALAPAVLALDSVLATGAPPPGKDRSGTVSRLPVPPLSSNEGKDF